jgi:hypothetical protein
MKTNVQIKDEPVEFQVNELLRLYGYNLATQTSTKKSIVNQDQERNVKIDKDFPTVSFFFSINMCMVSKIRSTFIFITN